MYFAVNHTLRHIYKLRDFRETFDDVMDENATWGMRDDIDFYEVDILPIETFLLVGYTTNIKPSELSDYIQDPTLLIHYMDKHRYSIDEIKNAIFVWKDTPMYKVCIDTMNELSLCKTFEEVINTKIFHCQS